MIAALAQGSRVTVRDHQGFTPLIVAARNGHLETCGLLLAHGSNLNEVLPDTKQSALHIAASRGHNASGELKSTHRIMQDLHHYMVPAKRDTCFVFLNC